MAASSGTGSAGPQVLIVGAGPVGLSLGIGIVYDRAAASAGPGADPAPRVR